MTPGSEDSGSSCSWDSCQHWSDNERGTLKCTIAQSYSCAQSASRPRKPEVYVRVRIPHGNRGILQRQIPIFQLRETVPIDISALRPWNWLGLLQGRVHPSWKSMIPTLQQGMQRTALTAAVIQQLLRASLETWYHTIWQPRCKRTVEQEQNQGLYQGTKIRRM
jgi:hypothetical protein